MIKKVKWGVLGYARIAKSQVIPAILKNDNSEFYGIASRSEENLKECKSKNQNVKLYRSYDELLDDTEIDAVYIPLPNSMHREWTIKACNKGKHVLCEKPIGLSRKECEEMIEASIQNNVFLMEAFMYRFTDRMKKLQNVLESKIIGEIKYIYSTYRFLLNRQNTIKEVPELGGGSLYDVGSYPVNFVGMITHDVPVSYSSQYDLLNGVDAIFSAVLKYKNGIIVNINSGFNAYPQMFSQIIGTQGILEIPDTFAGKAGFLKVTTDDEVKVINVEESDRYGLEIEHFSNIVLHNKQPKLRLEESLLNAYVLEKLSETIKR